MDGKFLLEQRLEPFIAMGFERDHVLAAVQMLSAQSDKYANNSALEHQLVDMLLLGGKFSGSTHCGTLPSASDSTIEEVHASFDTQTEDDIEYFDCLPPTVSTITETYDQIDTMPSEPHSHGTLNQVDLGYYEDLDRGQCGITCPICFDVFASKVMFRLTCGHTFCSDCMLHHCAAVVFPTCPNITCDHEFTEDEILQAAGQERLDSFQDMRIQQALDHLEGGVMCPNPDCKFVVQCEAHIQQRVVCHCGWPPFCSLCRQLYHPRKSCSEVGMLREQWASWISRGRQQYHGRVEAAAEALRQETVVQEALQRQRDLEADEEYKALNCRRCPQCGRTVEKLEGCDAMKCGENFHGGDKQNGCGAQFDWCRAPRYLPRVERRSVPDFDIDRLRVEGKDCRHFLVSCDKCGCLNMRGPRFRCVHCPSFNLCATCDLARGCHPADHVFEILFKPEHLYNLDLPKDTEVELVGLSRNITLNCKRAVVQKFFPGKNVYDLKLREPFRVPLSMDVNNNVLSSLIGGFGNVLNNVASSVLGMEAPEITLTPGEEIRVLHAMPARFVQIIATSSDTVARLVEAVETQRAARRKHWVALPIGTRVQVSGRIISKERSVDDSTCPHSQDRRTCAICKLKDTILSFKRLQLDGELGTTVGPYIQATDCFKVRCRSDDICHIASRNLHPLVTNPMDLETLEQFHAAQQKANLLRFALAEGQLVELSGMASDGNTYDGRLALTTTVLDKCTQCYAVRLQRDDEEPHRPPVSGRIAMAEAYGIDDLFNMRIEQMRGLWHEFDLPCDSLKTPDAFIEEALKFLPERCSNRVTVHFECVRPILVDAEEVFVLQERNDQERSLS